jgi:hypothetical protein
VCGQESEDVECKGVVGNEGGGTISSEWKKRYEWAENLGEGSFRRVLDPDRNPHTMVVIIHEEAINQYPGMAYYGGIFSGGEASVRAIDYILENPFPVRATIGVAGFWKLRGFSRFSMVHMILSYISQCFGH